MTKAKSSYRLQSQPRTSFSSGTLAAAFAGVVCLLGVLGVTAPAACAGGDTAPDWMRTAAQQTLPEYPKETSAVVLYDETIITVKDNGEIDVTHRNACKLLRTDGQEESGYAAVRVDNAT